MICDDFQWLFNDFTINIFFDIDKWYAIFWYCDGLTEKNSFAWVQRFAPYQHFDDENPNSMKEHAQMIQKFMDEISALSPLPPPPVEDEELLPIDEELQEPESWI